MAPKLLKEKKGAALVVALVIMLLIVMLSAALLLASYSLYNTSRRQQQLEQCKEIAQGVSRELREELQGPKFTEPNQVKAALADDTPYPLWAYLRCNLWQSNWPYYNPDEPGRPKSSALRTFQLEYTGPGSDDIPGQVSVEIYRESSQETDDKTNGTTCDFFVVVTCQIGSQKSSITTQYELQVVFFDELAGENDDYTEIPVTKFNPDHHKVYLNERWIFSGGGLE